jgi:TolB-like protein/Tfp pilus assembly protein PilF
MEYCQQIMDKTPVRLYEFGDFRLSVAEHALRQRGKLVLLQPKVFELLLALVENNGQEMRKTELMKRLWPDCYVADSNLTQSVFLLRKALGQAQVESPLIVTIPGRGYRFAGELKIQRSETVSEQSIRSMAVLPFRIIGNADVDNYLSLGLADALITKLSNLHEIAVRPTSAVLKFADLTLDPLGAGRELGVDSVLNGTLQQSDTRIRVTVQLARVHDGCLVWADMFEDDFVNIFALQDAISEHVGNALAVKLTGEERERVRKRYTDNHIAYRAYLKGRYYTNRWTQTSLSKAIESFQYAIQMDPHYALAYTGLSDANYVLSELYNHPREVMPRAKLAALKALDLDSTLAEAHTSLALVIGFYDWNWLEADREFRCAIDLNPSYAPAHVWHGRHLTTVGRFEEAITELKLGLQLDPLSPMINAELGRTLFLAGQFDSAITQLRETLELEPNFWTAHMFLGWAYEQHGHLPEATAILHRAAILDRNARTWASLAHACAISGKKAEAIKILQRLMGRSKKHYVSPYYIAGIYAALSSASETYTWLEKAYEDKSEWLVWLKVDPKFDSLRTDQHFQDLVQRVLGSAAVSHEGLPKHPSLLSSSKAP